MSITSPYFFVGIGALSDIGIDGGKKVKSSKTSQDELLIRYRSFTYFDQHLVASNAAKALLASLDSLISKRFFLLTCIY